MPPLTLAIKISIQRVFNQFGYAVHKTRHSMVPINVLPLVVHDLMRKKSCAGEGDFFFVQIGAHDGLHLDPIHPFVKKYHWRGILVEPQPKIFQRLVENYRDEPQLIFENAAISSQDGQVTLYAFKETAGLPDHATMLASFNRDALAHNGHNYKGEIEGLIVTAISVQSLLAKHHVSMIDFLQIDAEGYDFEIIQMLDFSRIKPSIIHFESGALATDELYRCYELIRSVGYRALTIGVDTIAYLQEDNDGFAEMIKNEGY